MSAMLPTTPGGIYVQESALVRLRNSLPGEVYRAVERYYHDHRAACLARLQLQAE